MNELSKSNEVESSSAINSKDNKEKQKFCGFNSVEDFSKAGLKCIVEATKAGNSIPSGASRDLYSTYPSFKRVLDTQSDRILNIISQVLKYQQVKGNIEKRDDDEKFELLQECNDLILERLNSNLDVMAGIKKHPEVILDNSSTPVPFKPSSGSWNRKVFDRPQTQRSPKVLQFKNIQRPQQNFKTPVDNDNRTPFEPKIKYKPNSIKPLAVLPEYDDDGNIESYVHPYEVELNKFQVCPEQLKPAILSEPKEIDETPFECINTQRELNKLMDELKNVKEIAVDLEHHSYRTFQGITCLVQISTREKDYVIDAISLREDLHVLNEIFTNPSVLKVFHGADSDIEWLQRDLSLYVVNMFDTHQGAKQIGLARLSLAYLLKNYCNIDLDKTYQLADWRIRPIPQELLDYARKDTHYLLYIYDCVRNELIKQANGKTNILEIVYQNSTEICKKRYIKPRITHDSFMEIYRKSKKNFDNRQLYALKHIFLWRDKLAREEDESYYYILPHHMMLQIAETLPREMQGILACCNPIPQLVRQHLLALHQIILKARDQPLVKSISEDSSLAHRIQLNMRDINNLLYCPHDLSNNTDFRDDLPTLLGDNGNQDFKCDISNLDLAEPILNFLKPSNKSEENNSNENILKLKEIKFVSPYKRYIQILPFAEQLRLEEQRKEREKLKNRKLCPDSVEEIKQKNKSNDDKCDLIDEKKISENLAKIRNKQPEVKTLNELKAQKRKPDDDVKSLCEDIQSIVEKKKKIDSEIVEKDESSTCIITSSDDSDVEIIEKPNPVQIILDDEKEEENSDKKEFRKKKNKKQKNKYIAKNKTTQNSNQNIEFDYEKVDFKRFQGGSQNNSARNQNPKSFFHGKHQNKRDMKKFNKMFSFSKIHGGRGGKK